MTNNPSQIWESLPRPSSWYVREALAETAQMRSGVPIGTPLGFATFDKFFRLRGGQLLVIAGRPAMGKTSFALQIAYNMACDLMRKNDQAGRIVFYSAEMGGVELYQKIASQLSGINLQAGYGGRWGTDETDAFEDTLRQLRDLPLMVNDLNIVKTENMRQNLLDMQASGLPPRALFFDYIELGADDDKFKENERVAQIAFRLKALAAEFQIPVVGISQVNRAVESEASKIPLMVNLAGSDSVPRTADKVLTLMRPGYYLRIGLNCACEHEDDKENTCYVSIQKDRFGRAGLTFRMAVNEETYQFTDMHEFAPPGRLVKSLKSRSPSEFTF